MLSAGDGLYYYVTLAKTASSACRWANPSPRSGEGAQQRPGSDHQQAVCGSGRLSLLGACPWQDLPYLKDGSGDIQTVADTGSSPADVIVVGTTVYWTDSTGVWTISIACASLPCAGTKSSLPSLARTLAATDLYISTVAALRVGTTCTGCSVYAGDNSDYQIRYRACNQIDICTIEPPGTFYAATTNWLIGNLVLANNNLYWTEPDQHDGQSTGDVKRKARTNTSGGADTIATGQAGTMPLFVANDMLFFARQNIGIYSLALNATAILREFTLDAMEVTQAIQNLANDVPLVARKTTYVRAYGKQTHRSQRAQCRSLAGRHHEWQRAARVALGPDQWRACAGERRQLRSRPAGGWLVLPAARQLDECRRDRAQGRSRPAPDPQRSQPRQQRTQPVDEPFRAQPPVCVWTVPVRTHTPLPSTTDPNFWRMVRPFQPAMARARYMDLP